MFGYMDPNSITVTWPEAPASVMTTVYGSNAIYAGSEPPPVGALEITNTSGSDSAYSYITTSPSAIVSSTQEAVTAYSIGNPLLQGLFCRGTLQASPTVLQNGYRFDFNGTELRLIEFNTGSPTVLDSENLTLLSPTYDYYLTLGNDDVSFHMTDNGTNLEGWLSAPGQPDTPHVTATDTTHTSGRIGLVSFANISGAGSQNYWGSYSASWAT
jgi:hypothetical protein